MQKLFELTLSVILLVVLLNFIQCALKDEFPRNEERNKSRQERFSLSELDKLLNMGRPHQEDHAPEEMRLGEISYTLPSPGSPVGYEGYSDLLGRISAGFPKRSRDLAEKGFLDTLGGMNGRLYGDADTDADDGKSETMMMEDKRMFDSLGGSAIHGYKRDNPLFKTKRYFDSLGGAFVHGYKKRYFDDLGDMAIHSYRKRYLDTLGGMAVHGEKRGFDTLGGIDVYKRYPKELYEGLVEGTEKRALDSLGGSYIPYGRKRASSTLSGEDVYDGYKRGLDTLGGVSVYKKSELEKKAEFDSLGGYAIHRFKRSKSDKTSN